LGTFVGIAVVWLFFELLTHWWPAWEPRLPAGLWLVAFFSGVALAWGELMYAIEHRMTFVEGLVAAAVFVVGLSVALMAILKGLDAATQVMDNHAGKGV
jgi:cytochrome b subunit of formate dehydrogenase